jgi:integrase
LSELLEIVNGTARRISAVCQLRYEDLRLKRNPAKHPFGRIHWPAETDKQGREAIMPIDERVREALNRILVERPGLGPAPLFPKPTDPDKPITAFLADKWLRRAEELAGVEKQDGTLWHAYRRKWATERKHHPDVDVAKAGGWASLEALKTAYQQADDETILKVVLEPGKLREVG